MPPAERHCSGSGGDLKGRESSCLVLPFISFRIFFLSFLFVVLVVGEIGVVSSSEREVVPRMGWESEKGRQVLTSHSSHSLPGPVSSLPQSHSYLPPGPSLQQSIQWGPLGIHKYHRGAKRCHLYSTHKGTVSKRHSTDPFLPAKPSQGAAERNRCEWR